MFRRVLCALLVLVLCSCGERPTKLEDLNATEITLPNGSKMLAETMLLQLDLTRGMMFRESLAADRGMLFIYSREQKTPFWMYQVRLPLDIIWLDRERHIVEIVANAAPCSSKKSSECPLYGGKEDALYVLELNAGAAAKMNLKTGDVLGF
jgi:uncharacterized membrane protein (UPF0127 family)